MSQLNTPDPPPPFPLNTPDPFMKPGHDNLIFFKTFF